MGSHERDGTLTEAQVLGYHLLIYFWVQFLYCTFPHHRSPPSSPLPPPPAVATGLSVAARPLTCSIPSYPPCPPLPRAPGPLPAGPAAQGARRSPGGLGRGVRCPPAVRTAFGITTGSPPGSRDHQGAYGGGGVSQPRPETEQVRTPVLVGVSWTCLRAATRKTPEE